MTNEFPSDFYRDMIKELQRLHKESNAFGDIPSIKHSLLHTIILLEKEMKWHEKQKWYDEEDINEAFGKQNKITDSNVIAWEELENMLIGEQLDYKAKFLGLEYNERMNAWC